jgi:hypothetical protein
MADRPLTGQESDVIRAETEPRRHPFPDPAAGTRSPSGRGDPVLGMKKYPKAYIAACRARVEANVHAYDKQVGKAASKDFEARYFNDQVLLLDYMFVHRLSGIEGKDGNPLNEVRILCNSLLLNHGKLQVEKLPGWPNSAVASLTLPPEKSVLKLTKGDEVRLNRDDFVRLSGAFFDELEKKYG